MLGFLAAAGDELMGLHLAAVDSETCVWTSVNTPCRGPPPLQDLIARLLERKPARRIGMLNARAGDIKNHKWFEGAAPV